jgi:hypothetical protein
MEVIRIEGTDDTPNVVLDAENKQFEIVGRSLPEDVVAFYKPILDWLDKYMSHPADITNFVFRLEYFNTASSKMILDVLQKLEQLNNQGHPTIITWFYESEDEDMLEAGEEYQELVEVPFDIVEY